MTKHEFEVFQSVSNDMRGNLMALVEQARENPKADMDPVISTTIALILTGVTLRFKPIIKSDRLTNEEFAKGIQQF